MVRKRFVFNGRVQGVGFRYLTRRAADLIGVTGWVRNELDGSVTMEIQGTEEQLEGVMLSLKHMIIKRGRYVRIESIDEKPDSGRGSERQTTPEVIRGRGHSRSKWNLKDALFFMWM